MKKIIISVFVIILSTFFGFFVFKKLTTENTYYEYTHFAEIPNLISNNEKKIFFIVQEGCSICKLVDPIVNEYAKNNKNVVYSIIGNKEEDYTYQSEKFNIQSTPTLIFFNNGEEVFRTTHGFTENEFKEIIKEVAF